MLIKLFYSLLTVGAGAAGAAVAARLSEDSSVTVAVLEAGKADTENWMANIPIMFYRQSQTEFDWNYKTLPQKHGCLGLEEQVFIICHILARNNSVILGIYAIMYPGPLGKYRHYILCGGVS
mgnify:CR=1 FL=1